MDDATRDELQQVICDATQMRSTWRPAKVIAETVSAWHKAEVAKAVAAKEAEMRPALVALSDMAWGYARRRGFGHPDKVREVALGQLAFHGITGPLADKILAAEVE